MSDSFSITETKEGGTPIVSIRGEIDLHVSPQLREILRSHSAEKCPRLILDFSDVAYIDSSGLATLIEYCRDSGEYGGKMALFGLKPKVRQVFDIVRLNELFAIHKTRDAALAAVSSS